MVGSIRASGYDGHIILGVHTEMPQKERDYLIAMDVTMYQVEFVDCDESVLKKDESGRSGGGAIRGKCSRGLETLTLEWGRFEMCRQ